METRETAKHGNRYDDSIRELAYQVWAFSASRKATRTAELLATGAHGEPVNVSVRTVNQWVTDGDWPARVAADLAALAPDLHRQTVSDLVIGSTEAAAYLRSVIGNEAVDHKHRITAAIAILDRAGFSHVGNKAAPEIGPTSTAGASALPAIIEAKTVDDLLRLEQELRARRSKVDR